MKTVQKALALLVVLGGVSNAIGALPVQPGKYVPVSHAKLNAVERVQSQYEIQTATVYGSPSATGLLRPEIIVLREKTEQRCVEDANCGSRLVAFRIVGKEAGELVGEVAPELLVANDTNDTPTDLKTVRLLEHGGRAAYGEQAQWQVTVEFDNGDVLAFSGTPRSLRQMAFF